MENFFSIVIDTCNHEKWISKCIDSCLIQEYQNYEIVIVDAKSDDITYDICRQYQLKNPKIRLYQNDERLPQVANFIWLSELSKPGSIIVSIDGDDWFKHGNVLDKLNSVYENDEVWMTYGSYEEFPYRDVKFHYQAYPQEVIDTNSFREYKWLGSHLRTFRKELILKIDENDLKDTEGSWLSTTGDQAIILPMLEMSGNKSRYIDDVLYVYNVFDSNRDSNVNEKKQIEMANYIRGKKKYNIIKDLG